MNSLQNVCNLVGKVVNIPQVLEHTVEAVCWDITMGAAGTALGQMFLSKNLCILNYFQSSFCFVELKSKDCTIEDLTMINILKVPLAVR